MGSAKDGMPRENWQVEHLLRRAAFGPTAADLVTFGDAQVSTVIDHLVDYERQADDVDSKIGQSEYVSVTTRGGQFSPNTNIDDARQRWLFRMVHSQRPLQEKMALFWHNHFAGLQQAHRRLQRGASDEDDGAEAG